MFYKNSSEKHLGLKDEQRKEKFDVMSPTVLDNFLIDDINRSSEELKTTN